MQLVIYIVHFECIGGDGAKKVEGKDKESYNSLDENEREMWQKWSSVEVNNIHNTAAVTNAVMTGTG